ncbi:MAG: type II secretion system F family protein, partial [Nitrosomonas sp.]|nr:type II secretion system F family protein [Nitrosomonas sp.]
MATVAASEKKIKEFNFLWEGKDKAGKAVKVEMRAAGTVVVTSTLRRQGIRVTRVKKRRTSGGRAIKQKDIAI